MSTSLTSVTLSVTVIVVRSLKRQQREETQDDDDDSATVYSKVIPLMS